MLINKVPKIWGQQNEKGNGGSPDPFFSAPSARVKKKAVAIDTNLLVALRAIDLLLTPTPSRDHMLVHY